MKLFIKQEFTCTAEQLWEVLLDPEFERRFKEEGGVNRQEVDRRDNDDGTFFVRRRVIADAKIPRPMAAAIGADRIEYDQDNTYDIANNELRWTVTPNVLPDRITIGGRTYVTEADGVCERVIDGDISIRVPMLGKKMEKKLAEGIETSYTKAAAIIRSMLVERYG